MCGPRMSRSHGSAPCISARRPPAAAPISRSLKAAVKARRCVSSSSPPSAASRTCARAANWSACCVRAPASPPRPLSSTPSPPAVSQRVRRGALGRRSSLNACGRRPAAGKSSKTSPAPASMILRWSARCFSPFCTAWKGALHLVSAYATETGLVLAQRAIDGKSNEITAIPELLDMLNLKGAIVSIDAMGTHKEIARRVADKGADYLLALKGNQTSLHEDAELFFADPALAASCARTQETDAGHGRIEERSCRAAEAGWLPERHPDWKGLRSIAAVTARRIDKKTGGESLETRYYITSLEPDPKVILAAVRAHWGIENKLPWTMDVTFDEDRCRTRKDASPLNFALIRHSGYNLLKADKTRGSLRRKRLRACIDPTFLTKLIAAERFR